MLVIQLTDWMSKKPWPILCINLLYEPRLPTTEFAKFSVKSSAWMYDTVESGFATCAEQYRGVKSSSGHFLFY